MDKSDNKLYKKLHSPNRLARAWKVVHANALQSESKDTLKEVQDFAKKSVDEIRKIRRHVMKMSFKFQKSRGVAVPRPGKSTPRPIVVAPIPNRIIQRAILEVLQEDKGISQYIDVTTSFGGLKDKNVRDALEEVAKCIKNGKMYYARSDIKNFFTKIPRDEVLATIEATLSCYDGQFLSILKGAVTTELENQAKLSELANLFPIKEEGVAQGSCLSPLIGNIFLAEFDKITNSEDVTCIRFIDDFIILGPGQKGVLAKMKAGIKFLNDKGLEVHDPFANTEKADHGLVTKGFDFLGCTVTPDRISPNSKTVQRIKANVSERLEDALLNLSQPSRGTDSYAKALRDINNSLKGWGNSYSFCNNAHLFSQLDKEIGDEIDKFSKAFFRIQNSHTDWKNRQRLLGVHLMEDSYKDPIYKPKVENFRMSPKGKE